MNIHKNARLTPAGRLLLMQRIKVHGWEVSDAATAAGISVRRSYCWLARYRAGGEPALADQLGAHGVLAWSEGDNQGRQKPFGLNFGSTSRGLNVNVHEIRRSLIAASEMQQDLRDDEIIIVPANGLPIRCGRAIFFRRKDMVAQIAMNRFAMMAGPAAE